MPTYPSSSGDIKFARVNATSDGDNTAVAAVSGKKIRVLGYVLTATAAGTAKLQDTAGTAVVHAEFSFAANGSIAYAGSAASPAFETAVGEGVEVNTTATQDVLGHLTYIEI